MPNLALPGNPRYQPKDVESMLAYDNLYGAVAEVEIATLRTLADIGIITREDISLLTPEVEQSLLSITTTEVDEVERKITKHDIRAWVRLAQEKVDPRLRRWIHVPLTSFDALDTARSLQFVRAHEVVRALTGQVIEHFATLVFRLADQRQIGRTHGQHALPITVGFWLATILNRIVTNIKAANGAADALVGKISGAVGAYNAQEGLGFSAKSGAMKTFEDRVLQKLGLLPARISTQILPPEPLADYLFSCVKLSAALGQFGRDGRHLMRSEIGEIGEPFVTGQVGSSTMAHKRNPINFENLDSTWLKNKNEFGKVLDTMISEHQRDLVGSAISRDFPVIVVNLVSQLKTLLNPSDDGRSFLERIDVIPEACERNFAMQGDAILAEPVYIALQMAGYEGDAHELVNHKALAHARATGKSLIDSARDILTEEAPDMVDEIFGNIPEKTLSLLGKPEDYIGVSVSKAVEVANAAERYLKYG